MRRKKKEETGDTEAKHYKGQFYVILWPQMEKVKGLSWKQAEKLWREHTDRAMILSMQDLMGGSNGKNAG